MAIEADRIMGDIEAFAGCTETPRGVSRPTFSPAWRKAIDYVIAQTQAVGCRHRFDAAGNLRVRQTAISWESPVWIAGGHLDTIGSSGRFSGAAGVAAALEVMRAARTDLKVALPMELVVWAESGGATFGQRNAGGRALIGEMPADEWASLKDKSGRSYADAGAPHGVAPEKAAQDLLRPNIAIGAVEVRIEPAGRLWNTGMSVGLATLGGRRVSHCNLLPAPRADGALPSIEKPDLAAGAAAMITALEKMARDLANETRIQATRLRSHPEADDAAPDEVLFTIDFRSPSIPVMAREHKSMSERLIEIAHERRILVAIDIVHSQMPVEADKRVKTKATKGAQWRGVEQITDVNVDVNSELLYLVKVAPTLLIAVASDPDLVGTPREACQPQDLVAATAILFETVKDRRLD